MFKKLLEEIKKFDTIIIHRHFNPDGDAMGSQIGLKHILKDSFPEKNIFAVGDGAGNYSFMDDCVMDEISDDTFKNALSIILDCGSKSLISDERFSLSCKTARIDHHTYSGCFTDLEVIDSTSESCCGQITRMAMENDLKVSPLAAKSLFTGMVTDSGRFRYDSTSSESFKEAAFLMEKGFDLNEIYLNLYSDDFKMKQLRAEFILKIKLTDKNVAYIYTTKEELASLDTDTFTVSRGMVNTMADIKGVDVWANFTETDKGILCELRSGKKSIVHIARKYGGGGHAKACGATLSSKEQAMEMLRDLDKVTED